MTQRCISILVLAALLLIARPAPALADDLALGVEVFGGNETHIETGNNASVYSPVPLAVLDAHVNRFEITGEWLPLPSIPISNNPNGIHSITLNYLDGSVRYWVAPNRWALGIGETLWNQQTEYLYMPVAYDASRGAGARYELVNSIPLRTGVALQTSVAAAPTIHAILSYTYGAPGYWSAPISEQEAQVDVQVAVVQSVKRWRLKYGLRYTNLTAKFPNGSFADANHIAGLFVAGLYDIRP
ncbi:MAG: hypothetical protein WBG27_04395 [Candidatus Aquilonibacter sp.]